MLSDNSISPAAPCLGLRVDPPALLIHPDHHRAESDLGKALLLEDGFEVLLVAAAVVVGVAVGQRLGLLDHQLARGRRFLRHLDPDQAVGHP